jgi:hypothetical protein
MSNSSSTVELSGPPDQTWMIQSYALCILAYVLCAVYALVFAKLSAAQIKETIGETTDGFITARKSQVLITSRDIVLSFSEFKSFSFDRACGGSRGVSSPDPWAHGFDIVFLSLHDFEVC